MGGNRDTARLVTLIETDNQVQCESNRAKATARTRAGPRARPGAWVEACGGVASEGEGEGKGVRC